MGRPRSALLGQKPIQLIGEDLAVGPAEGRGSARVHSTAAQGVEKIPHVQALADVFFGVELAAGVQGEAAFGNHLGGQGYVGGDDQVARPRLLDDVVVRNVESGPHLNGTDIAGSGHLEGLIGDQDQRHAHPVRRPVEDLFDHLWAGVGIDPNTFGAQFYFPMDQFWCCKTATTELATRLEARGYAAAALNGDMAQPHREQMVQRLKQGSLDILVATDVAARGLDLDRISHVVNYDIPYDTEAYIHRIGRTGRAGRKGDAILFVAPRERRMLRDIERATRQKIEPLELPSSETVNSKRIADFKQRISDSLAAGELDFMQGLVEQYHLRKAWVCGQRLNISRLERTKRKKQGGQKASKGTKSG